MKRTFKIHRVFPLGKYKNVQFSNEAEFDSGEEVPPVKEIYRDMLTEIYDAFFAHVKEVHLMESVKTIAEKEEIWKNARSS